MSCAQSKWRWAFYTSLGTRLHTQKRWFGRDFCNGPKLRHADLESGAWHIGNFCVTLWCSVNGRENWNPLRRKWIFSCEDWDLEHQALSANSANIAFVRDSKTERAVPPWNVTYPRNCWQKTPWLQILGSWAITKVQITFKRQKKPMLIRCKFLYQR